MSEPVEERKQWLPSLEELLASGPKLGKTEVWYAVANHVINMEIERFKKPNPEVV